MKKAMALLFIFIHLSPIVFADESGTLEKVGKKVEEKKSEDKSSSSSSSYSPYSDGSVEGVVAASFIEVLLHALMGGLYAGDGLTLAEQYAFLKQQFHPALPTIKLEGSYQKLLGDDIQGYHLYAVAGYLPFAIDVDWVHYFEGSPKTQLKMISPHVVIRYTPIDFWEMDFSIGAKILRGRNTHTGVEVGMPMSFFFSKHVILDVRPYLGNINGTKVWDVGGGISGKWKYIGARAGYRLIDIGGERLHGPEGGLFFQW